MNLLYYPQVSMRDYETNRFRIFSDAQFTKAKGIIAEALRLDNELQVTIVLPSTVCYDSPFSPERLYYGQEQVVPLVEAHFEQLFPFYNSIEARFHVHVDDRLFGENAMTSRFNFPYHRWSSLIHKGLDVILNEVPELSPAFAALCNFKGVDASIVSMYEHYEPRYEGLQREAAQFSTGCIFPSNAIFDSKYAHLIQVEEDGIAVLPHLFCAHEIKAHRKEDKQNVLVFPSRFSDDERTKYNIFLAMLEDLSKLFDEIWILNPNHSFNPEHDNMPLPLNVTVFSHLTRTEYLRKIAVARYGMILYDVGNFYSVSLAEMLGMGMHIFFPYETTVFQNVTSIGQDNYRWLLENKMQIVDRMGEELKAYEEMMDTFSIAAMKLGSVVCDKLSGEAIAKHLLNTLNFWRQQ